MNAKYAEYVVDVEFDNDELAIIVTALDQHVRDAILDVVDNAAGQPKLVAAIELANRFGRDVAQWQIITLTHAELVVLDDAIDCHVCELGHDIRSGDLSFQREATIARRIATATSDQVACHMSGPDDPARPYNTVVGDRCASHNCQICPIRKTTKCTRTGICSVCQCVMTADECGHEFDEERTCDVCAAKRWEWDGGNTPAPSIWFAEPEQAAEAMRDAMLDAEPESVVV